MAEVLLELTRTLARSTTKPTKQELETLGACPSMSLKNGAIGSSLAGSLAWIASGRLSRFFRCSLAGGVGFMCGMWSINRSLDSCVDHILSMEGTRMKTELARIIVRRYRNDPQKMKLLSKHFYSEEVFDDSASDRPKLMFRQRNSYIDNAAQIPRSSENYGHDDSDEKIQIDSSKQKENNDIEKIRKTVLEWRQANDDPFDWLFDRSDVKEEEVPQPSNNPSSPTKLQSRRQRRLHRHRRLQHRHHGDSPTKDNAYQHLLENTTPQTLART